MMAERAPTALGQGGQALPVVLALAALAGLALVALYNVGQTASARVRLTHAADAAAYSGALEQARTLNLLAYINRAQVAHQIAMAHIVTLASWARFGQAQSTRRTQGNPPASLISMLFGSAAGAAYARSSSTGDAVPGLARAFQQHDHVVHQVLQRAAVEATDSLAEARLQSMLRVLHANYPEHYADPAGHATAQTGPVHLALLHDNSAGYVEQRRGNGDTGLRGMIELSAGRHDFLRPRDLTRHSSWIVQRTCPTRRHELRRRGGTWLDGEGRWGSLDTLSYHALRSNRWIGCYYREYAMGWGQAGASTVKAGDYVDKPPQDFSQQDFWRWVHENTSWNLFAGRSNPLANSYAVAGAARWPGKGLPSYHDVDPGAARQPLRFAIQVRQSASALATTDAASKVAAPAGRYAAATGLAGEEAVTVTSAAETYFARPESRADGRSEYANLFRPYWQARLSAPVAPETGEVAP
ncbi:pilus assembly protein TadG-related protein [Bordetella petrii]|uniref:pilus assembly protein TadG-related protein n=1 Tax=Bordetella petrii TaxID=94624 RepID=UPI00048F3051|nr:pilus assembly protein TadG-related protein [Bordetella petrii]